ncbi:MAG: hypothetical protein HQK50_05850 [Oligoflexia bacterium]|nr:hypothetical protein [Oligoflexia bacterium]MBF0365074.1 hypothetical protein [Oligoflexia bacterium]
MEIKKTEVKSRILSQKGQGILEYIIISSLVGLLCLVTVKQFGDVLERRVEELKARVTENLKIKS